MKKFIKKIIDFISKIQQILVEVYVDTWEDEIIAEDLNKKIEQIREDNKAKYIGFAAGVYTHEAAKRGEYLPDRAALRKAHKSFIDSVLTDKLDVLYNIKGEGNESNKKL